MRFTTLTRFVAALVLLGTCQGAFAQSTPTATATALPAIAHEATPIVNAGKVLAFTEAPLPTFMVRNENSNTIIIVRNMNAASRTVTVTGIPEPRYGRSANVGPVTMAQYEVAVFGPFGASGFNVQNGANAGRISITVSAVAGIQFATIPLRLP